MSPARPHPSATVVLLRDGRAGLELLLLRRNSRLDFHGGAWVFPGGRVDAADHDGAADVEDAARRAAVREAHEEAGLRLDPRALVPISHWTTPEVMPKRFATWFFAAQASADAVQVDGGEIHGYRWFTPETALGAQRAGEIELPAPTFVTTLRVSQHRDAKAALDELGAGGVEVFAPRIHVVDGGRCSVYQQDTAYADGDLDRPGPRHRLWMLEAGWRYERELDAATTNAEV